MKICVGLSGGVDSSVAALLLKQQGHEVFAMFMQNWKEADVTLHGDCEWEEDRQVAEMVARQLGIPFYFVDLSKQYRERVVDYMFDEYAHGRTPNPDILCNREIKFDAFLQVAGRYGAERVATGHYCRIDEMQGPAGRPVYRLLEGTDPNKDQSYFLCQLTQEQLAKALFPIGALTKPQVRKIAADAGLFSADKKDSQGICFVGKVDLPAFLQQKIQAAEGDVIEIYDAYYQDNVQYQSVRETLYRLAGGPVEMTGSCAPEVKVLTSDGEPLGPSPYGADQIAELSGDEWMQLSQPVQYPAEFETETYRSGRKRSLKTRYKDPQAGQIIGKHSGAQFYTIGQRKGLHIGGRRESLFVIGTDPERNIVYVGEGRRHKGLWRSCLRILPAEVHWIRPDRAMSPGEIRRCRVRIRYRQPLQSATIVLRPEGLFILFDRPQRGIAPGQFAVWYEEDEMTGSGVIYR